MFKDGVFYVFEKSVRNPDRSVDRGFTVSVRLRGVLSKLKDEEGFDLVFLTRERAQKYAERFLEERGLI